MAIDIQSALLSPRGLWQLNAYLAEFIRSDRHEELEALLSHHLAVAGGPVEAACKAATLDRVRIVGWGDIEYMLTATPAYSAVGIDLSTYPEAYDEDGLLLTPLETSYYTDEPFAFSTAGRDAITAACREAPVWRGAFSEVMPDPRVEGLDALHALLASTRSAVYGSYHANRHTQGPIPDALIPQLLGEWWVALRLHQAIRRDLAGLSFVRRIPIVVGNHGTYPEVMAVYYPSTSGARPDTAVPSRRTYGPGGARGAKTGRRDGGKRSDETASATKAAMDATLRQFLSRVSSVRISGLNAQDVADLTDAAKLVNKVLRKRFGAPTRH